MSDDNSAGQLAPGVSLIETEEVDGSPSMPASSSVNVPDVDMAPTEDQGWPTPSVTEVPLIAMSSTAGSSIVATTVCGRRGCTNYSGNDEVACGRPGCGLTTPQQQATWRRLRSEALASSKPPPKGCMPVPETPVTEPPVAKPDVATSSDVRWGNWQPQPDSSNPRLSLSNLYDTRGRDLAEDTLDVGREPLPLDTWDFPRVGAKTPPPCGY